MDEARTDAEALSQAPIKVTLLGVEHEIPQLKWASSIVWGQAAEKLLSSAMDIDLESDIEKASDLAALFKDRIGKHPQALMDLFWLYWQLSTVDSVNAKTFAETQALPDPALDPADFLLSEITECSALCERSEMMAAAREVMRVANPLACMLEVVEVAMAGANALSSGTSSRSQPANGAEAPKSFSSNGPPSKPRV